uniref:Odorant receptor n=1 Tax=Cyrtorhinus lividipennis TaxID=1032904 RepID=A0A346TI11_9HEMI|nr:odorant receptor 3 [Cyrtorhinus lividipennis]
MSKNKKSVDIAGTYKDVINSAGYKANFGTIMKFGALYNETYLYPVALLIFFIVNTSLLAYTITLATDDVKLMAESAHFTMLRTTATVVLLNSTYRKPQLTNLFLLLGEPNLHDYGGTLTKELKAKIQEKIKICVDRKEFYGKNLARGFFVALVLFATRSILEYFGGFLNQPYGEDGINRNLPVPTYMPYDSEGWPGYQFALISEAYLVVAACLVAIGNDCSFICFSEEVLRELQIIIITLGSIKERSEYVRRKSNYKISVKDSVHLCLKHSVKHHQRVIQVFEGFRTYFFFSLFIMLGCGAFLVCLSGLMFIADVVDVKTKILFFIFLASELFHIFVFCYYGEHISFTSRKVGESLYDPSTVDISQYVKPFFIMINARCQTPLQLSGGGFMNADFDTYGNVLRSSYSYLNLLQAAN